MSSSRTHQATRFTEKARFLKPAVLFANPGRVRLLAASAAAAAVSTSRMEEGKEEEEGRENFEHLEHPLGARTSQLWTIDVQEERKYHLDRAASCRRSS